jgi:hypothetical protein
MLAWLLMKQLTLQILIIVTASALNFLVGVYLPEERAS